MQSTMIGLDIAKHAFQVHAEDGSGGVLCKRLCRHAMADFFAKQAPAVVGIEACGSSHYWVRTLSMRGGLSSGESRLA